MNTALEESRAALNAGLLETGTADVDLTQGTFKLAQTRRRLPGNELGP